jgi:SHR-binding domain of vacuolar-sorting associated protein 13
MFEVVIQIQYLPYPFSFSKVITFQPKYVFVNKTFLTLYVIQSDCEERGQFKIFPQETSIFHWTDSMKRFEVSVRLEGYEFSGNFKIDSIGEMNLRLRSTLDHDNLILNVSINEENNSFYIVVSDVSYAPPYRIENMTKATIKVCQKDARSHDFDILKPFHIASFAWSYPLEEKLLSISLCT